MPPTAPARSRRLLLTGTLLTLLVSWAAGPLAAAPPLELTFEPGALVVSGLTPGGEALLFSVAREPRGYFTRVARRDEVLVADATGAARFELLAEDGAPADLPLKAVWVVVDWTSGGIGASATPGFPAEERGLPPGTLRRGPGNLLNRLADRLESAEIVLIRPGGLESRGIWGLSVMDGSVFDQDESDDGAFEAALDDLIPLADGPPPPEEVVAGDVVVLVDPRTLTFFAVRLTA
jgi:hypothetical protein